MNLILLFDSDFRPDGTVRLEGRRAKHVHEVHRAQPGDELSVGKVDGPIGRATVLSVASDEVVLAAAFGEAPPPATGIDLLLAMPRPKVLRRVLQAAASLGVGRLVLVNSARVEKSYFSTPFLAPEAVHENLVLGLEQGRDTRLPQVLVRQRFKPFVEDELEGLWPSATTRKLLPHPIADGGIERCEAGTPGAPAVLAIGPEGGWIPYEVGMLEARGFQRFALGPRILRVDTAVPYAVAQLELARRVRGT